MPGAKQARSKRSRSCRLSDRAWRVLSEAGMIYTGASFLPLGNLIGHASPSAQACPLLALSLPLSLLHKMVEADLGDPRGPAGPRLSLII